MRFPVVLAVVGELLFVFAASFGPPFVLAVIEDRRETALAFATAMGVCLCLGVLAHAFLRRFRGLKLHRAEAFASVTLSWLALAFAGGIPYYFAGLSFVDGLFESMSGLTATAATTLDAFEAYDPPLFLWRSLEQWIGGLGAIALFVVVFPQLGVAGRQLFFAEASNGGGSPLPHVRQASMRLWGIYAGLTFVLVAALMATGIPAFDAVCTAFSTLSAGGFSPHPRSIAGYENPAAEWVLIPFMLVSGLSFTLLYLGLAQRSLRPLRSDPELRTYLAVALVLGVAVTWTSAGAFTAESLRHGLFQVASLISTTGFVSAGDRAWSDATMGLLILAMVAGGCAGSAAGGPKVVRLILSTRYILQGVTRTLHPAAILPYKYKGGVLPGRVMRAVVTLVVLYALAYLTFGVLLVLQGLPLATAFSCAIAAVGNNGPGLGEAGPLATYAGFSALTKLTLISGMWIGRLEIVAVLVLFHPDVWRNVRIGDRAPRSRPRKQAEPKPGPTAALRAIP